MNVGASAPNSSSPLSAARLIPKCAQPGELRTGDLSYGTQLLPLTGLRSATKRNTIGLFVLPRPQTDGTCSLRPS